MTSDAPNAILRSICAVPRHILMLRSFESKLKQLTRSSGHSAMLKSHNDSQKLYRSKVEEILNSQIANSASTVQYSKYVLNQAKQLQDTKQLLNNYSLQSRIFIPKGLEKAVQQLQSQVVHELVEQKEKEYLLLLLKKYDPQLTHSAGIAGKLIDEASQCQLVDMSGFSVQNDLVKSMNPETKKFKTSQWVLDYLDEAQYRYKDIKGNKNNRNYYILKESFHDKNYQDKLTTELKENFELTLEKRSLERETAQKLLSIDEKDQKINEIRNLIKKEHQRREQLHQQKREIEKLGREIVEQMKSQAL